MKRSFVPMEKGKKNDMSIEEAIEALSDIRAEYNIFSGDENEATRYHALSWAISLLKSAADVVTCKECKWWNEYYRECQSPNWSTGTDEYIVQPAGMSCSWGERKEE